jgi:hypothetical protein
MKLVRGLPFGILILGLVMLIGHASTIGTYPISTATMQLALTKESVQADSSVVTTFQGVQTTGTGNLADNGSPCTSPREAVTGTGNLRYNLVTGDLEYRLQVREVAPDSWDTNALFRLEVFDGNGTLLARRYFDNSNNDDLAEEGVRLRLGLGSATVSPRVVTVIITKLTDCSGE